MCPDTSADYEILGNVLLALQHFAEAGRVMHEAEARKLEDNLLRIGLYALAFLGGDSHSMAEQVAWFNSKPEYENYGLSLVADTAAYAGRLRQAREFTRKAVDSAMRTDNKENAAIWLETGALRETVFGNTAEARRAVTSGLKMAPASPGIRGEAALASSISRDSVSAGTL